MTAKNCVAALTTGEPPHLLNPEVSGKGHGLEPSRTGKWQQSQTAQYDSVNTIKMDDLYRLSLVEAARRLASEEVMTSEVYARGLLLRVRELDESISAWAWLQPAQAIERAREADQRVRCRPYTGRQSRAPYRGEGSHQRKRDAVWNGLPDL